MEIVAEAPHPLEVIDVSTGYGKKQVLTSVSFAVEPSEVFGLIGLNGAGKTTLIRSILGLRAAKGRISIFSEPASAHQARRHLIYLPEKFQPSSQLLGWEYLSILLSYFGQKLDRERGRSIASALDLDPSALDRRVRTYSKGMGQKLGLVGTFLVQTPLMILDEPMSGLDPRARALLKDRLIQTKREGRSIFFSSHILSDIAEICDRIGVLHGGRIIFLGRPDALVTRHNASSLERAFLAAIDDVDRA